MQVVIPRYIECSVDFDVVGKTSSEHDDDAIAIASFRIFKLLQARILRVKIWPRDLICGSRISRFAFWLSTGDRPAGFWIRKSSGNRRSLKHDITTKGQ